MLGISRQWSLIPLLVASMAAFSTGHLETGHTDECKPQPANCVPMDELQNLVKKEILNTTSAHDWSILLNTKLFKKITRWPKLHGCVMSRVADFYDRVLHRKLSVMNRANVTEQRNVLFDLIGVMQHLDDCVSVKEKKCVRLYAKAETMPFTENTTGKKLKPRQLAILQIQRLYKATAQLHEADTLAKALDELKRLPDYIVGSGVLQWSRDS